jgi:hypothetical protein
LNLRLSIDRFEGNNIAQEIIMSKRRNAESGQTQASPRSRDGVTTPVPSLEVPGHPAATGQGTPAPTISATEWLSRERIAARAYDLWDARGRPEGSDLEDWFEAERELSVVGK